jgi:hypothetical protein
MFLLIIGALIVAIWFVVFWIQPLAILSIFERLTPNVILSSAGRTAPGRALIR